MDKSDESIRKEQTSIYPWTLSPQKSFLNPTPKGTFTHRPLFKCQGQLKIKFIFPLNNISKEINAILTFGITSPLLKWKKIPPYLSQSQGSQLSPNARINLVGKLCSTVISPFPLFGTNQIQRTAQTVLLFWNLLYQILPETGALVAVAEKTFLSASRCLALQWDQPALFPLSALAFPVVSYLPWHLPSLSPHSVPTLPTSCKAFPWSRALNPAQASHHLESVALHF